MPTKAEIQTWLVEMQSDLINKPNLLKNKDVMGAWDSLTKSVKNKEKDKFQTGFEYLENIIHRDFKVPPWRLLLQRKRYASGKEIILSTLEGFIQQTSLPMYDLAVMTWRRNYLKEKNNKENVSLFI